MSLSLEQRVQLERERDKLNEKAVNTPGPVPEPIYKRLVEINSSLRRSRWANLFAKFTSEMNAALEDDEEEDLSYHSSQERASQEPEEEYETPPEQVEEEEEEEAAEEVVAQDEAKESPSSPSSSSSSQASEHDSPSNEL